MIVEVERARLTNVIRLYGVLETNNAEEIYAEINRAIQAKVGIIIIDITRLKFIQSGGSKILEECHKKAEKLGIKLFIDR